MGEEQFIDYVKIFGRSGNGGAGSAHLARTARNPKAGPDGGDGGHGGSVIVRGNRNLWTLLHLRYTKHIFAENGGNGQKNQCFGKNGADALVEVPLGTIIKLVETDEVIGEILEDGEELVVMKGGRGGLGNVHFKSATMQTPRFAQPGELGTEGWMSLELKVLADVGLVGFPNAGKSTLISQLSNARPKIANYPFTTLKPNLGMVAYRDYQSFVIADIPGIIEGASEGKGIGLRFLRHIERNSVLLYMVPIVSEEGLKSAEEILKEFHILQNELKQYNPELLDKSYMVAITKCDLAPQDEINAILQKLPKTFPHLSISSLTNYHLTEIKDRLWELLNKKE
ncbi:MAG: GTPase ObgE [Bacteroidales bacterium]|nr:GTPase ObgE [Bacteroidales bacterium]